MLPGIVLTFVVFVLIKLNQYIRSRDPEVREFVEKELARKEEEQK